MEIGNLDFGEEEFELIDSGANNELDDWFDEVVGALQEILMDPDFERM